MATKIRSIPELKGKIAKVFINNAEIGYSKRHTVDFSKQVNSAKEILKGFYSKKHYERYEQRL
jgi:hypothetical protein